VIGGQAKARGVPYEQVLAERVATIPAGRIGDPEEFGAACAWLCSAQAGFITGQNLAARRRGLSRHVLITDSQRISRLE
jgi:NAD(P)-dependent dehydrogenase (short-subunit alcohol dehydrogenase family)